MRYFQVFYSFIYKVKYKEVIIYFSSEDIFIIKVGFYVLDFFMMVVVYIKCLKIVEVFKVV